MQRSKKAKALVDVWAGIRPGLSEQIFGKTLHKGLPPDWRGKWGSCLKSQSHGQECPGLGVQMLAADSDVWLPPPAPEKKRHWVCILAKSNCLEPFTLASQELELLKQCDVCEYNQALEILISWRFYCLKNAWHKFLMLYLAGKCFLAEVKWGICELRLVPCLSTT